MCSHDWYTITPDGLILAVRVLPGAKRCGFGGIWNETHLKIALCQPAVDGKANAALIEFLKEAFSIRLNDIEISTGHKARLKTVKIKTNTPDTFISLILK